MREPKTRTYRHSAAVALVTPLTDEDGRMAVAKIRRNRPKDEAVVRMPAPRVRESTSESLMAAAHESGLSFGLYLELLTQHISLQEGRLPILVSDHLNEELPISA